MDFQIRLIFVERRQCSTWEVAGSKVNCGVGLGLETPCVYHFSGRNWHGKFGPPIIRPPVELKQQPKWFTLC